MVDPTKIGGAGPRVPEGPSQSGHGSRVAGEQGVAFKALLEKLDSQARRIQQTSEQVDRPEQLAGAVDEARTSLDQALSLGNQLLEAFRANQLQLPGSSETESSS